MVAKLQSIDTRWTDIEEETKRDLPEKEKYNRVYCWNRAGVIRTRVSRGKGNRERIEGWIEDRDKGI